MPFPPPVRDPNPQPPCSYPHPPPGGHVGLGPYTVLCTDVRILYVRTGTWEKYWQVTVAFFCLLSWFWLVLILFPVSTHGYMGKALAGVAVADE